MQSINLPDLRAQFAGTRLRELVQHHLRRQSQRRRIDGLQATINLLPEVARGVAEGFIDRWNAHVYDQEFWERDTSEVFDDIIADARTVLRPLDLETDDEAAFNLFEQAKGKAPCIIFLDELDALGKARGVGPMAHEEREQTLNQLLVEMDGFDSRVGVILVAATNRPEILDPALLRAGRFDRQVLVDRPDKIGRLAILKVHARTITIANQADLETIAAMTPGFVGADLANLLNEAALLAVRRGKDTVSLSELQEAVERVIGGLEKKNRVLNKMERARVAHHEVGHALVAMSIPGGDAVHKISIIPRGIAALGYTMQLPTEDRFLMTVSELKNRIAILLGGRAAEEVIYGEVSTGAQDDLRKATDIAKSMVKAYGMSEKLGQVSLERDRQSIFLQTGPSQTPGDYSEQTSREIDCEVRVLIDEQYEHARNLITSQEAILRKAAQVLLEKETISGEELKTLAASH